jgi:uncharacterized membrane protein
MKHQTKIALFKTLTYRGVCIVWIFSIAFFITGNILEGIGWALLHQAVLTVFYFVHEKLWDNYLHKS